jgi:RNA polymerase sigma-70 factor (ECF subfamily)
VYSYLRSRADNDEDAADLTQQVFLQALDGLPRYQNRGLPFAAWLLSIARNLAINFHKGSRRPMPWDLLPEALQASGDDDVGGRAARGDLIDTLFAHLDPHARELLLLRFGADLTVAEIALVIGKSEAATRMRLIRTLRTLRENYHDEF